MSTQRYTPEFKEEAVRQIVDRGYSVADVSARLGVSSHSLYQWVKAVTPDKTEKQASHWSGPIAWPGNALNAPLHRGQRRCRRGIVRSRGPCCIGHRRPISRRTGEH